MSGALPSVALLFSPVQRAGQYAPPATVFARRGGDLSFSLRVRQFTCVPSTLRALGSTRAEPFSNAV